MSNLTNITVQAQPKLADGHGVLSSCLPGARLATGLGVSEGVAVRRSVAPVRERIVERIAARPAQAPAVAAVMAADAVGYDAAVAHGAGSQLFGRQKTQLASMWALRGLNPWSDPA
ncbi:hypothetical protein [Streptomyces aidingensis]|uniref:Uncharacterized protein n=1 Tax=Streptomyces aidingensis TaxID=910347 RepID=A0A1I1EXR4_9ACTN|nr:hypothetical protein [Streptomyces aidingensis]SFB91874.1 hypothetical protein SAMN05421773_101517 [Streptomyces aidingensis]